MNNKIISPSFDSAKNIEKELNKILKGAAARAVDGFIVREDYLDVISDYRRKETLLWPLIKKVYAKSDVIREIVYDTYPKVDFRRKALTLTITGTEQEHYESATTTVSDMQSKMQNALGGQGQELKALMGIIEIDNFGRSLYEQQGAPYFDQIALYTNDLITQAYRKLEMTLFEGNAELRPYEFNGIAAQMHPENVYTADVTGDVPDRVLDKLDEIVLKAATDVRLMKRITHIFCSGAGYRLIQKELKEMMVWSNTAEISPGVVVPTLVTAMGQIPIVVSPYVRDKRQQEGDKAIVTYWLIDVNQLEWHGLIPYGGAPTLEPQIFDVRTMMNNVPLLDKRMVLCYGTLFARNRGRGIYRLDVTVEANNAWNFNFENSEP